MKQVDWWRQALARNIASNYLAALWLGGLGLALIPVYLHLLGPQLWGVVAICLMVQAFAGLLDAGLGQILPREMARAQDHPEAQARVYRSFARAYLGLGALGLVLGQAVLSLALHGPRPWYGPEVLEHEIALRLVLIQFFFQFSNNAALGTWNGLQQQGRVNRRQCGFGTAKHGAALVLLALVQAQPWAYVAGFTLVSALEWWLNQRLIKAQFGHALQQALPTGTLRLLARETGLLALAVLLGMLVSQLDRIVLSVALEPIDFGRYVIVVNLGLGFLQLQYPLMRALFPRVVRASSDGKVGVRPAHVLAMLGLCVMPCLVLIALAPWVLQWWLGDAVMVERGTSPLRLIVAAVALNGLYHLIYQSIVAHGRADWVLAINVLGLLVVAPFLWLSAPSLGLLAGAWGWFIMASLQLTCGCLWLLVQRNRPAPSR